MQRKKILALSLVLALALALCACGEGGGGGGAAAQPGPVGHTLVEHDSYGPRTVAFVHQPPGPQADIVLRRTIDRQPQLHEFGFDRRLDLQPVVQLPHRHHYRRHVVESVGPTAKHVQPDIDLAVGS